MYATYGIQQSSHGQVPTSVVSRHPSRLVPSRFSCPVMWFPDRDWVRREWKGRKSLNLCIIWLKVSANVKKLKKLELKSQFWELLLHYPSSFSLYFELWIKFCVVSNPVSTRLGFSNRVSICPVPPKTCLNTTLVYWQSQAHCWVFFAKKVQSSPAIRIES